VYPKCGRARRAITKKRDILNKTRKSKRGLHHRGWVIGRGQQLRKEEAYGVGRRKGDKLMNCSASLIQNGNAVK